MDIIRGMRDPRDASKRAVRPNGPACMYCLLCFHTFSVSMSAESLRPKCTMWSSCLIRLHQQLLQPVSGQKSEPTPHFTEKLRLLTHPLTFLLVKQPQIFKDGNYYELIKFTFT